MENLKVEHDIEDIKEKLIEFGEKNIDCFNKDDLITLYEKYVKIYFLYEKKFEIKYCKKYITKLPLLSKKQKQMINDFEFRIREGKSIRPYLSNYRYLMKFSKEDELLSKYNIYHAQVGEVSKRNTYVKWSDKLIFFTLYNEVVYFIDIKKHPIGGEWENAELLAAFNESLEN